MSKKEIIHRKRLLRAAVLLALGTISSTAYAATSNNNFTMLDSTGSPVGGTNDVTFTWDCTLNTDPATATSNATLVSTGPTPFFGLNWTAYNVKIYGPGTYTLSTADSAVDGDCPAGLTTCASGADYNVTVPAGSTMAHMKFAWGSTEGIDVVDVWQTGSWTALNTNSIFTGPGGTYSGPSYSRVSIDWDGDGKAGAGMIDGPFAGFNANFNVSVVGGEGIPEIPVETQITTPEPSTAGGGCSIGRSPTGLAERGDWWLVTGFLAWLGALRIRFKRQQARS